MKKHAVGVTDIHLTWTIRETAGADFFYIRSVWLPMPLSYANYKYSIFIYEVKYPKNSLFKLYTFCYKRNVCENVCIAKDMKIPKY